MSEHCQRLLDGNPRLKDVVVVVHGKVEEVLPPEPTTCPCDKAFGSKSLVLLVK
jgi:hypothetical protein